jgi:hypothetical protein
MYGLLAQHLTFGARRLVKSTYTCPVQMPMCTVSDLVKRTGRGRQPTHAQQLAMRCLDPPTRNEAAEAIAYAVFT